MKFWTYSMIKDKELEKQFKNFLKRDLNLFRKNRYKRGYRQTNTCTVCKDIVYSKLENTWSECECGDLRMKECGFYYIIECEKSVDNSINKLYDELGE